MMEKIDRMAMTLGHFSTRPYPKEGNHAELPNNFAIYPKIIQRKTSRMFLTNTPVSRFFLYFAFVMCPSSMILGNQTG
jgi:hypothetical protein